MLSFSLDDFPLRLCNIMAPLSCTLCGRNAVCACVCSFPLPLLCEEHRLEHRSPDHIHFPPQAARCIQTWQVQSEIEERCTELHELYAHVQAYDYSDEETESTLDSLLVQLVTVVDELKVRTTELKDRVEGQESASEYYPQLSIDALVSAVWNGSEEDGELGTWLAVGRGVTLRGKSRYQESCSILEERWRRVRTGVGREVLVLALALAAVMGLHVGRFTDALALLDTALQAANRLQPQSEVALQLTNMKAAVLIHLLDYEKCEKMCIQSIESACSAPHSEVSYGTALYFFVFSSFYDVSHRTHIEALVMAWAKKTKDSCNSLVRHIRLCITALFEEKEGDFLDAERHITEASDLAKLHFSTSNYAAMSYYLRDRIGREIADNFEGSEEFHRTEDDTYLHTHFPASLLRASILMSYADRFRCVRDYTKEIELRQRIHLIVQEYPCSQLFLKNVILFEDCLRKTEQIEVAFDLLCSALHILMLCDWKNVSFLSFLDSFHSSMKSTQLKRLERVYIEILQICTPTHRHFCDILEKLLVLCKEQGQNDLAVELCLEKYKLLRTNVPNSSSYIKSVEVLGGLYYSLEMREKRNETFLEGLEVVRIHRNCKGFARLMNSFLERCQPYPYELQRKIRLEAHQFFVANCSRECAKNIYHVELFFRNQPDKVLKLRQEIHQVLQLTPTCPEYITNLCEMIDILPDEKKQEKVVKLRECAHQALLAYPLSRNFIVNVQALMCCYREANQIETAYDFQVQVHKLLSAHPTSDNFECSLRELVKLHRANGRPQVAVQLLRQSIAALDISHRLNAYEDLVSVYREIGNTEAAIQARFDCLKLKKSLPRNYFGEVESIADLYIQTGRSKEAVRLCCATLQTFLEQHLYSRVSRILDYLSSVFTKTKQSSRGTVLGLEVLRTLERAGAITAYEDTFELLLDQCYFPRQEAKTLRICMEALRYLLPRRSSSCSTYLCLMEAGSSLASSGQACRAEALFCRVRTLQASSMRNEAALLRGLYL